ncbi:hypothetical protein I6N98_11600 [Spongiibacter nanhainus]|uniref:Uncharacterized protein n=1 Tax=Spongiibacter nanhainus TaxID=2794344 RepID=A0A7T4QY92_9GAMM|nr:hypothetical protein [Spongiibacter nanhainus]QQD17023.1 hypothetical protein I6N98_11600 [Spongiibacter nanhainus]
MLAVFSVIVFSMVSGSNINFKIAGNQQYRMEAKSAARNGIEAYISNAANFALPLPETDATFGADFDGDGVNEMLATVPPPKCIRVAPVKITELEPKRSNNDKFCVSGGGQQNTGLLSDDGVSSGNSICTKMTWDVSAAVSDTETGANLTMHQGIYIRAYVGTPCLN